MGVLDDAIREHLELKRKHGASDVEVERQEQEALGPQQRQPAAAPEGAESEGSEPETGAPPAPEAHESSVEEDRISEQVEPEAAAPAQQDAAPPLDEGQVAGPAGDPLAEDAPDWDFAPARDAEPATGDTPAQGFDPVDEPADEEDDEDVLEETPDFLQETPEHDRLWFEQKPPRDFDFEE